MAPWSQPASTACFGSHDRCVLVTPAEDHRQLSLSISFLRLASRAPRDSRSVRNPLLTYDGHSLSGLALPLVSISISRRAGFSALKPSE